MVPVPTLGPRSTRRRAGHAAQRSPILYLENAEGPKALPRRAEEIARRSAHTVALAEHPSIVALSSQRHCDETGIDAWRRLQGHFHGVCIGVVAEQGSGIADAALILADGWGEGSGPGAMALLGFSPDIVATCLRLTGPPDRPATPGGGHGGTESEPSCLDMSGWPPMVVFLPADDPGIAECAGGCRLLRSAGIPIRLEIMRSARSLTTTAAAEAAIDELVIELDRFFTAHLTPAFPKRL